MKKYITNCKNCGAVLKYNDTGKAKCEYCSSEYFMYDTKKVKKQKKVTAHCTQICDGYELKLYGEKMKFYLAEVETIYEWLDGEKKYKITLISY